LKVRVPNYLRSLAIGSAAATLAYAHYTWVAPAGGILEVGKPAVVRICHGHEFPIGDELPNISNSETSVLSPSGRRVKLAPVVNANEIGAPYTPREPGLHRLIYVQDRGILSRTPDGVKPGGKDRNPTAAQSFRSYRSAIAYLPAGRNAVENGKPAGVEVEFTGLPANGAWELRLLRSGKPEPGVTVQAYLSKAPDAVEIGKTDANGKLTYRLAPGAAGPILFSAEWKVPPPAGAAYDTVNYSTSLYVTH